MDDSRSARTYASALQRNEVFGTIGLHIDIPKVLAPQEQVVLVLPGVAGNFPDVMVVTTQRFLLTAVAGPLKDAKIKREAAASDVAGVSYRKGLFSRVAVDLAGQKDVKMVPHNNDDAERFAAEFDHLIRTGRLPG